MPEPSSALYDFVIAAHADFDLRVLARALQDLQADDRLAHKPAVELYGRPESGEVLVLLRFPFAAYASALRHRMDSLAQRLKGRLIEPQLLAERERKRVYAERLDACEVRVDAADPAAAVDQFRARMGLGAARPAVQLRFGSADDLAQAYARVIAEGALFVPSKRAPEAGTAVELLLAIEGGETYPAEGTVASVSEDRSRPGFRATLVPGPALADFLARQRAQARQGRLRAPVRGSRAHARYDSCLDVRFTGYEQLRDEFARNLSKGGLFVRTVTPPPLRARVELTLHLPDGTDAVTEAEVVHVLSAEEAARLGTSPGAGLSFGGRGTDFLAQVEGVLESYPSRRSRVLVVDDDRFFRTVICEALGAAGFDCATAGDGAEALRALTRELFEIDLLVLDLHMPGLDGGELLDRVRRLGGELDLKVLVLSAGRPEELEAVRAAGANDALRKGAPTEEVVARIRRLLGQ